MVKVKVIEDFHLGEFNKLKNIIRANPARNAQGFLYVNDIFECDEDMARYLLNEEGHKNPLNRVFVDKIPIEVVPEKEEKTEKIEKTTKPKKRQLPKNKK